MSALVALDQRCRGLMSDILVASTERLQVCAAYLAVKPPVADQRATVGELLSSEDHLTLLSAAFGEVPKGFRRALSRIGPKAQDQRCYSLLHQTLSKPPSAEVQDCVYRLSAIDRQKLLIMRLLPPRLARPNVVTAIKEMSATNSISVASDVTAAYILLVSRGVDAEALAQAICKVRSERELMNLWDRWLMKARCPDHPIPASDSYTPISSGEELNRLSLQYRNCASKRYLLPVMSGEDAMATFSHDGKSAMVHLRHSEDRWRCEGAYGPRNAPPPSSLREALYEHLEAHGVVVISSTRRKPSEWDPLRRLARSNLFDFEFNT